MAPRTTLIVWMVPGAMGEAHSMLLIQKNRYSTPTQKEFSSRRPLVERRPNFPDRMPDKLPLGFFVFTHPILTGKGTNLRCTFQTPSSMKCMSEDLPLAAPAVSQNRFGEPTPP